MLSFLVFIVAMVCFCYGTNLLKQDLNHLISRNDIRVNGVNPDNIDSIIRQARIRRHNGVLPEDGWIICCRIVEEQPTTTESDKLKVKKAYLEERSKDLEVLRQRKRDKYYQMVAEVRQEQMYNSDYQVFTERFVHAAWFGIPKEEYESRMKNVYENTIIGELSTRPGKVIDYVGTFYNAFSYEEIWQFKVPSNGRLSFADKRKMRKRYEITLEYLEYL